MSHLFDDWYEYKTDAGEPYYFNSRTQETSWERPGTSAPPPSRHYRLERRERGFMLRTVWKEADVTLASGQLSWTGGSLKLKDVARVASSSVREKPYLF